MSDTFLFPKTGKITSSSTGLFDINSIIALDGDDGKHYYLNMVPNPERRKVDWQDEKIPRGEVTVSVCEKIDGEYTDEKIVDTCLVFQSTFNRWGDDIGNNIELGYHGILYNLSFGDDQKYTVTKIGEC